MIRISRYAACLTAMLAAAVASALAAPAAFATIAPPNPAGSSVPVSGGPIIKHPATVHTVLVGGMPGWQIALIAAGAAVLAAALAVVADRLLAARRASTAGLGRRAARVGSGSAA
jgi:hypothetical protein